MARASRNRTSPGKRRSPSSQSLAHDGDGAGLDAAVALVVIDVDLDLALGGGFEGGLDVGLEGLVAFTASR